MEIKKNVTLTLNEKECQALSVACREMMKKVNTMLRHESLMCEGYSIHEWKYFAEVCERIEGI